MLVRKRVRCGCRMRHAHGAPRSGRVRGGTPPREPRYGRYCSGPDPGGMAGNARTIMRRYGSTGEGFRWAVQRCFAMLNRDGGAAGTQAMLCRRTEFTAAGGVVLACRPMSRAVLRHDEAARGGGLVVITGTRFSEPRTE